MLKLIQCFVALMVTVSLIRNQIQAQLEINFDRMDFVPGSDIVDPGDLRIRKFNRSTFIMDGNFKVLKDLDNNYEIGLIISRANLASNSYTKYPLKIPGTKMCDYLNGTYQTYQVYYKDHSNLPQVGREGKCPLPKGDYYMKTFQMPDEVLPPTIPQGNWRLNVIVTDLAKKKEVFNCGLYLKVTYTVKQLKNGKT